MTRPLISQGTLAQAPSISMGLANGSTLVTGRPGADGHHGFGAVFGFLAQTSAIATPENYDVHANKRSRMPEILWFPCGSVNGFVLSLSLSLASLARETVKGGLMTGIWIDSTCPSY
jgi:hypothetical protein